MLFRRFIILTIMIALTAIVFINIVQATNMPDRDFAVDDRLKQWERFEEKKTCSRANKACHNEGMNPKQT